MLANKHQMNWSGRCAGVSAGWRDFKKKRSDRFGSLPGMPNLQPPQST
jgi:hypothetical protein